MPIRRGALRERLVIQRNDPASLSVSSITRSGTTATVTMVAPHGYTTGDYVTIAGAGQSAYNGKVTITATGDTTFTYTVSGAPATPATGTITATYASDAQGGRREVWRTLETIWAELQEIRGLERLQLQGVVAERELRFRTRVRDDVRAPMRLLWTPSWPRGAARRTLEIHAVRPVEDGRTWMLLEAGEVA